MQFTPTNLHTLALRQGNPRLLLTDDEDVTLARGELVVDSVLNVYDVEAAVMTFAVSDNADTTHVATTGSHGNHTSVEAYGICDFAGSEVDLDSVVNLDGRVWVADAMLYVNTVCVFDIHIKHVRPLFGKVVRASRRRSPIHDDIVARTSHVRPTGAHAHNQNLAQRLIEAERLTSSHHA